MRYFLDANICLDLLDTTRKNAPLSVAWYLALKDDIDNEFFFSGDFITTFYYVLTERKGHDALEVVEAVDALSEEILPVYPVHSDFILAKEAFFDGVFDDFEDLMVLESAVRIGAKRFLTHDMRLLALGNYKNILIAKPELSEGIK